MRTLIISVSQRPDYTFENGHLIALNVSGEDALALYEVNKESHPKIWIGKRVYSRLKKQNFKTIDDIFWVHDDDYDAFNKQFETIIVFTQKQNFFGGILSKTQKNYFNSFLTFEGHIRHYVNDPLFLNYNEILETLKRLTSNTSQIEIDGTKKEKDELIKLMSDNIQKGDINCADTVFPNLNAPINSFKHTNFTDVIRVTHKNVRKYKNQFKNLPMVYVGIKRPDRVKRLKSYKNVLENEFKMYGGASGEKMISTIDTIDIYESSIANVVLGDIEHSNTGMNHRVLQGLYSSSITFIEKSLDPYCTLILEEKLRDFIYFETAEELKSKYEAAIKNTLTYEKILSLQNDEIDRINNESIFELINRTTIYTSTKS